MDKVVAKNLIEDTFQHSFNEEQFYNFVNNLLNHINWIDKQTDEVLYDHAKATILQMAESGHLYVGSNLHYTFSKFRKMTPLIAINVSYYEN